MKKNLTYLLLFCAMICAPFFSFGATSGIPYKLKPMSPVSAETPVDLSTYVKSHQVKKGKKGNFVKRFMQKKLVKKLNKKLKKKAARSGLLSDSRVYWGLIFLAGGLLTTLLFAKWIAWIGSLAMVVGLVLIIWGLIDGA